MKLGTEINTVKDDILKKNLLIQNILQEIQAPETTEETLFQLNADFRLHFKSLKRLVDEFAELGKEQDEDSEFKEDTELYRHQLITLQTTFRKANIQSQMSINVKNKSELLYSNTTELDVRSRKSRSQDDVVRLSKNMTSQLSNISQHLASVVEQSKNTVESLVQSSQTVSDTQEEFKVMGSAITSAKKLVTRYGRREVTDMFLIVLAAFFFLACCFYVVLKRVF